MNARLFPCAAFVCLGLGSAAAEASEPGWYVFAFGGESSASGFTPRASDENLTDIFNNAGFNVDSIASTVDDSDTSFGLGGGYQLNENFAFEFAYLDLGSFSSDATATLSQDEVAGTTDVEAELESSASGPVVWALGILPIGERFSVYGRAGIGLMQADGTLRVTDENGTQRANQSSQKTSLIYGAGAEYSFAKYFAVRLAWDRYTDVGTDDVAGNIDADVLSLGIRMGVGWFR